jgi:RNA polymerase sigma factor (sigma-70 family)
VRFLIEKRLLDDAMLTDAELLQRYVKENAEDAFGELVHRHLNLVYAAALRQTNGRHALAEEVAQTVFTKLARKAWQLTDHPALTGWLHRSTRYATIDALRAEQRREKLTHALTPMSDEFSPADSLTNWEQLRPVIDEAMDQLNKQDREIVLLRFFQGLSFAEVGEHMNLAENTARMRTERALDKLRSRLGKRGITSAAAMAGLLAGQTAVAVPATLAASVTSAALAAPVGVITAFFTSLLMNKIAFTSLSAVLAAGVTSAVWAVGADRVSDADLAALREENARLKRAAAPGATATTVATVAHALTEQTNSLLQSVTKRLQENHAAGTSGHRNHGQATPYDAFLSYMWAIDAGESEALENLLTYDANGRENIKRLHASMPATIRAAYPTPEKLVAFLFIADTILRPIQGADMLANYVVTEIEPGHVGVGRKEAKRPGMHWLQTPDGWKLAVPPGAPEVLAKRTLGNEMLDKLGLK